LWEKPKPKGLIKMVSATITKKIKGQPTQKWSFSGTSSEVESIIRVFLTQEVIAHA